MILIIFLFVLRSVSRAKI